ncbi:hypothetical protein LCL99_02790 [Halomonas denitrificans]|uniref:hypothetical protein n=1 Tax=Halomonas denitrificans TaxID=370769 RepID=UPI001CD68AE0|nr:hypothetical protein [Halomonas denitrificans]MCA0973390.1 hypothetical protein [Halomonas denitrificans]
MDRLSVQRFSSRAEAERYYLALIDSDAEAARCVSPAQEAVYQLKLAEAAQGSGPMVEAEANATGADVATVCQRIKRARTRWEKRAGTIEEARITAKADIRRSSTPADMHRALTRFRNAL